MSLPQKRILPNLREPEVTDDQPAMRRERALAGAFYGLVAATVFAVLSGTIDALTYPDLPIYINWGQIGLSWAIMGGALAVVGALAGWFREGLVGIGVGAAAIAISLLTLSVVQSEAIGIAKFILFLILFLPISAASVPIALGLRWLVRLHVNALARKGFRLAAGLALTLLIAVLMGAVPGLFMRMSRQAERGMYKIQSVLAAPAPPDQSGKYNAYHNLTGMPAHWGEPYLLQQVRSITSTEGYDISVVFESGYSFTCTVVVYGDYDPYVRNCVEK